MEALDTLPSPASEGLREIVAKRFKVNRDAPSGLSRVSGKPVGYKKSSGYWNIHVSVNNKSHHLLAHRVIWELTYGEIPSGMQIDHINRDRSDNRIENLRLVTMTENMHNKGDYATNTTGHKYVMYRKDRNAYIFRIKRFGKLHTSYHKTLDEAVEAKRLFLNQ